MANVTIILDFVNVVVDILEKDVKRKDVLMIAVDMVIVIMEDVNATKVGNIEIVIQ